MDALTESTVPKKQPGVIRRKKKEPPPSKQLPKTEGKAQNGPPGGGGTSPPATSPSAASSKVAALPPQFYRETLIGLPSAPFEPSRTPGATSPPSSTSGTKGVSVSSMSPVGAGTSAQAAGPNGDLSKAAGPQAVGGKKKVRFVDWAKSEELVEIRYFEVDDSERVNVNKAGGTTDMKHLEMQREKEMLGRAKGQGRSAKKEEEEDYIPWKLAICDSCDNLIGNNSGANSKEKLVEMERQKHVLQSMYLPGMVPDYPKEPEPGDRVPSTSEQPLEIPTESEDTTAEGSADPTATPSNQGANLPPELASLMANLNSAGILPQVTEANSSTGPQQQTQPSQAPVGLNPMMPNPMMMMPPNPMMMGMMPGLMNPMMMGMPPMMPPQPPRFPPQQNQNPVRMSPNQGAGGYNSGPPPTTTPGPMDGARPRGPRPPLRDAPPRPTLQGNTPPRQPFPTKQCPFYAAGRCHYGDRCKYEHTKTTAEGEQTRVPTSADRRPPPVDRDYRRDRDRDRDYRGGSYRRDVDHRKFDRDYRDRRPGRGRDYRRPRSPRRRRSRSPRRRSRSRSKSKSRSRSHSSSSSSPSRSSSRSSRSSPSSPEKTKKAEKEKSTKSPTTEEEKQAKEEEAGDKSKSESKSEDEKTVEGKS